MLRGRGDAIENNRLRTVNEIRITYANNGQIADCVAP